MSTNRRFISFFLILIAILLFSCDNGLRVSVTSAQEDGRAYLFISTGDNSRTVFPEQLVLDSDMSLSFELKGGLVGSGQTVLREWTATSSTAYVAMIGDNSLTVEAGEWNFTLEAKRNNLVILSAAINSMDIVAGVNKLSFGTMEENRTSGTGTVDVTVKLPADSGVSHVGTGVLCVENGGLDDTRQELTLETGSDGAPFFRYYRENVESGSYSLMIQLTQDKDPNVKYVFREAVQVAANLTSSKTCSISSLSTVYSVTYNLNTTGGTGSWKGNSIPQDFYNPYDILVLPVAGTIEPPTGYFFGGWYEDSSFSGNPVTMIGGGSSDIPTGAKSFYAKWTQELYVGGPMASDANDGGNVAAPLATIQAAVDKIVAANDGSPYTILLMGDVRDSSSVAYVSGKNFSLVNIVPAATLNLTIKSNIDGTPRTIDAGRNDISTGRVMYVGANASVTLQDVIVTGGYVKDTSGGGILATSTATSLTLSNCEVSRNTVENGNGGGLYVAHDPTAGAMELALQSTKVNLNTIIHKDGVVTYSGAGVGIENSAVELKISANSQIQGNTIDNSASIAQNPQAEGIGLWLGNSATTTVENTVISGNILTAKTGSKAYGGGIYVGGGELTLGQGANVSGHDISSASGEAQGGGIHIAGGQLTLTGNAAVGDNKAFNGGGIAVEGGTLSMSGGEISGNAATANGGGVYMDAGGIANIAGGTIGKDGSPNTAENGGGIAVNGGIMVMTGAGSVSYNEVTANGGGVYVSDDGTLRLDGGSISGNQATNSNGGGVSVSGGTFTMDGGEINLNTAVNGTGGGVYVAVNSTFNANDGVIGGDSTKKNTASNGGGVYVAGVGTDTTVTAGKLVLAGTTISYNESSTSGGGVANYGTLEMSSGSISNNTAGYNGGGINNAGTLTMTGGSIEYNTAASDGGGVYIATNASLSIIGTSSPRIAYNSAKNGGGVYIVNMGILGMGSGFISGNTATQEGAGVYDNGMVSLGGSASISSTNVFYLSSTADPISITSTLTESSVASIYVSGAMDGKQVLQAGQGSNVALANEVSKFTILPDGTGYWSIDTNGQLVKQSTQDVVLAAIQNGSSSELFLFDDATSTDNLRAIFEALRDNPSGYFTLDLSRTTLRSFSVDSVSLMDANGGSSLKKIIFPATLTYIDLSSNNPFSGIYYGNLTVVFRDTTSIWKNSGGSIILRPNADGIVDSTILTTNDSWMKE